MRINSASKNLINIFGKISDLNLESQKLLNIYKIPNHYQNYKRLSLYFGDWRRIEADCLYLRNRKEFETFLVLSKMANFKIPSNLSLYDNSNSNTDSDSITNNNVKKDKDNKDKVNNLKKQPMELNKDNQLIECSDFVKNCKFIYFGNLDKFVPNKYLKSLIIPLDLFSDYYELDSNLNNNSNDYFEGMSNSNNVDTSTSSSNSISNSTGTNSKYSTGSKDSKYSNESDSSSNMYQMGLKSLNNAKKLITFLEDMESVERVLLCAENNNTWTKYHKLLKYS